MQMVASQRWTVRLTAVWWLEAPDAPVIVTVRVPIVALLLAVSVNVLVVVAALGLKEAETPFRNPETENVTLSLKPFKGVIVTAVVPVLPRAMLKLDGDAERLKFGAAVTVRGIVVEALKAPEVPVTVTLKVPVTAATLALSCSELLPVVLAGLNDVVTPLGRPEADKLTLPLKPLSGLTVMVLKPWFP